MSNKKKIIIAIVILFIIWLAWKMYKSRTSTPTDEGQPVLGVTTSSGTNSSGSTSSAINNDTVFSLKSPMMSDKRVQWMQYEYNRTAKARNSANVTPSWPIISEDGKFGSQTNSAMIRMMGKGANSYKEVKQKADWFISTLNTYGSVLTSYSF